jgi:hypothetical protein
MVFTDKGQKNGPLPDNPAQLRTSPPKKSQEILADGDCRDEEFILRRIAREWATANREQPDTQPRTSAGKEQTTAEVDEEDNESFSIRELLLMTVVVRLM